MSCDHSSSFSLSTLCILMPRLLQWPLKPIAEPVPGRQSPKPPLIWHPNKQHKRQISEAIPRNERLNSPETAPTVTLEQGPEHTQEETRRQARARVAGHEGLNSANGALD